MKITKVEIRRVAIPMVRSFTTGFGTVHDKHTVITKLHTADGLVGYGEASSTPEPVYNHESVASCFYTQQQFIGPRVIGRDFDSAEDFRNAYKDIVGNPIARAGMECAFWHLLAQSENKSLKQLFGGDKTEIPAGEGVGMSDSPYSTVAEVERLAKSGYRHVKIKIAPGRDHKVLHAVRAAFPDISLSVDGNGSYRYNRDHETLQSLEQFGLTMLEQPFAADDLIGHAELQKKLKTPVCLDESVTSVNDAHTVLALKAGKIINVKPGRVGGIAEAMAIHDYAADNGVGVWCGGMGETGIGRAFNIAFASKKNCRYPADMSPYHFFYTEDLVEDSFEVKPNGQIDVPDTAGLGFKIRDDAINRFTVDKAVVKA